LTNIINIQFRWKGEEAWLGSLGGGKKGKNEVLAPTVYCEKGEKKGKSGAVGVE